jgi:hypothetical protein
MQFELTPEALANFSPGFSFLEPWEPSHQKYANNKNVLNPEGVRQLPNPFRFIASVNRNPWFSLRFEPWAGIANTFGVPFNFKLMHYQTGLRNVYGDLHL